MGGAGDAGGNLTGAQAAEYWRRLARLRARYLRFAQVFLEGFAT